MMFLVAYIRMLAPLGICYKNALHIMISFRNTLNNHEPILKFPFFQKSLSFNSLNDLETTTLNFDLT